MYVASAHTYDTLVRNVLLCTDVNHLVLYEPSAALRDFIFMAVTTGWVVY